MWRRHPWLAAPQNIYCQHSLLPLRLQKIGEASFVYSHGSLIDTTAPHSHMLTCEISAEMVTVIGVECVDSPEQKIGAR